MLCQILLQWGKNLLPPPISHPEEQVTVIGKGGESRLREVLSSFEIAVWGGRAQGWENRGHNGSSQCPLT